MDLNTSIQAVAMREKSVKRCRTDQSIVAREAYIIYEPCPDREKIFLKFNYNAT